MDTNAKRFIDRIVNEIEEGSFRHQVLECSRRFKSNWFELGRKLTEVAKEKSYEEWGYASFADYCRLEIRIRVSTAMKLTGAYFFLKEEVAKEDWKPGEIPDLESVRTLEKAKNNPSWTPELYEQLKTTALESDVSPKAISKKYRDIQNNLEPGSAESEKNVAEWNRSAQQAKALLAFLKKIRAKDKWIESLSEIHVHLEQKKKDAQTRPPKARSFFSDPAAAIGETPVRT